MKQSNPTRILVLALSISGFLCFGQQNRSAICRLGENAIETSPASAQSLEINLKNDSKKFINSPIPNSVNTLILIGDADQNDWQSIFKKIKTTPSIQSVVFESITFESLPYGYEGLYTVSELSFRNDEKLDHSELITQLKDLPNLRTLNTDLYSIFDLPEDLSGLKNLVALNLNKLEEDATTRENSPVSFDYLVEKNDQNKLAIKYTATAGKVDNSEYRELTKRFSISHDLDPINVRFKPKYANVKPPIKGIDVERETYTLNPTVENVITYPSGTIIRIPANAFVDKNGNEVRSSIQINYREFRDPVDFLVSGIPMKYDTAGVTTNFQSAGMFELTASVGSEPVQMAPDQRIDMNFQTTSKDSTYNFYAFNDQTGNWEYLEKPKTVTKKTLIPLSPPTPAYSKYINFIRYGVRIPDTTSFANRYSDKQYAYTRYITGTQPEMIGYHSRKGHRSRSVQNLVKIDKVIRRKDGIVLFHIDYLQETHPELAAFKDVFFQLNDAMSASEFKQKFFRKKAFSDIRLSIAGNDVMIELKDTTGFKSLNALPVKINTKGEVIAVNNAATRVKKYSRALAGKERNFNRDLKKKHDYYWGEIEITDRKAKIDYAFKAVSGLMNENEKKMTKEEFVAYCKEQEKNEKLWIKQSNEEKLTSLAGAQATSTNLMQSLSLEGMGIFNCDQIQRMEKPVEIFASYKSQNSPIVAKAAYVIDKKNNSVFQYDGYRGYSASKIAFDKSSEAENSLLAIGSDDSISLYQTKDFERDKDELRNGKHFDFTVTKINAETTNIGQLKALMGF